MKRVMVMLLSFMIIISSGCGAPRDEGPVSIIIWHDKQEEVASVLQAELDKLAPNIKVELIRKDNLTEALKLVGNNPSAAPDMYWFAHDKVGLYAELGILAPITDLLPKKALDNYLDMTLSAATYKGVVYQLPLYFETLLFMYNKEYMSKEEVPQTTEALLSYMKTNTKDGRYGFVEQHSTPYYSVPWIHAFGGSLLNEDGTPGLNRAETIAALEYHLKFLDYMPGESEYSTVNTLFLEGRADAIIGGPWLVGSVREAGIDLGFARMPVVDETGKPLAPYSGVQGLQVLKIAAQTKKNAITKILNLLLEPGIGIELARVSGCAPANKLCYDDKNVANDEMVMMMKDTAELALPMPNRPEMDIMWTVVGNLLVKINLSGGDIKTEADKAQEKAIKLINAMK